MSMNRHPDVEIRASETIYRGAVFSVIRERITLPSGLEQDLAIVDHPGAVAIAALESDGRLLLVRQYRHAVGDWLIEVPAGRLEPREDPLSAAKRELEEETGHRASEWSTLGEFFPAPGFCSERMTLFLARGLAPIGVNARQKDADEELELVRMTAGELARSKPRDSKTWIAALLLLDRGLS